MPFKINSEEFANEVIKYVGRYNVTIGCFKMNLYLLIRIFGKFLLLRSILLILEKNFTPRLKFFISFIVSFNSP